MRGINESMDFCLVYVHGKHEYYLDADEYVFDAVKHLDEGLKNQNLTKESDRLIGLPYLIHSANQWTTMAMLSTIFLCQINQKFI